MMRANGGDNMILDSSCEHIVRCWSLPERGTVSRRGEGAGNKKYAFDASEALSTYAHENDNRKVVATGKLEDVPTPRTLACGGCWV